MRLSDNVSLRAQRWFIRLASITTILTYFLIGVGATVRVTGAGMGCPDWPMCFGQWIPPTSVDQLPPLGSYDYPPGWDVASFDPVMTYIEYVNRLVGVVVGLAILATLVSALRSFRHRRDVLFPVVVAFVGVLYSGWLGARVVAHELAPWIVTAHLLSAVVVVSSLLIALINAQHPQQTGRFANIKSRMIVVAVGLIVLLQGAVGTQVRGAIEDVVRRQPALPRAQWSSAVGDVEFVHSALGLCVLLCVVLLAAALAKTSQNAANTASLGRVNVWWAVALAIVQVLGGVVLVTFAMPRMVQVAHLLGAVLLLGVLSILAVNRQKN